MLGEQSSNMMSFTFQAAVLVLSVQGVVGVCQHSPGGCVVRTTSYGDVEGFETNLAQIFYGVPFASPPARWTDPADPTPWSGHYNALAPKAMCYQDGICGPGDVDCVSLKSEDCLYLNIFAPLNTQASSAKAVIFYIHGGNFLNSTGASPVMNGEILADQGDVIVVTINYRLGAFGFLVAGDDITGNYGLKDQRQALLWVHENIGAFGGNNSKITMTGQSAGAYSTAIHFTSGNVDDLFSHAVLHSTPWTIPLKPLAVAEAQGGTFASLASCMSGETIVTSCLQALTADQVVAYQFHPDMREFSDNSDIRGFMPWLPHIDGVEVMSGLLEGFEGALPEKEILFGTVKDEGMPYVKETFTGPVNIVEMVVIVEAFTKANELQIGTLAGLYPNVNVLGDNSDALSDMTTDYVFVCPGRVVARELADRMDVYTYSFQQPLGFPEYFEGLTYCAGADDVCHGIDVPYWFQSARFEPYVFNQAQTTFSDKLVNYWVSFAKYGHPNQDRQGAMKWPRFKLERWSWEYKQKSIILEAGNIDTEYHYREGQCKLWDSVGYD